MADEPEPDDETLVLRMMEKDEDALVEVIARYGPRIRGFLSVMFGDVFKKEEREEVFNIAAFNLYRFADRYDADKGSLKNWFIKIARNAAVSFLRKEMRCVAQELEYEPSYDPGEDCADTTPPLDSREAKAVEELDNIIHNKLKGFEQIMALNDYKAGGEADIGRIAAKYGKSKAVVSSTRSKVNKKILQMLTDWEARQPKGKART